MYLQFYDLGSFIHYSFLLSFICTIFSLISFHSFSFLFFISILHSLISTIFPFILLIIHFLILYFFPYKSLISIFHWMRMFESPFFVSIKTVLPDSFRLVLANIAPIPDLQMGLPVGIWILVTMELTIFTFVKHFTHLWLRCVLCVSSFLRQILLRIGTQMGFKYLPHTLFHFGSVVCIRIEKWYFRTLLHFMCIFMYIYSTS